MSEFLALYRQETPPRTMGSETEFTTRMIMGITDTIDPKLIAAENGFNDVFLRNGARVYVDGQTLEYATPECHNGSQVALYEKAGERIVRTLSDSVIDYDETLDTAVVSRTPVYKRTGYGTVLVPSDYEEGTEVTALDGEKSTGHHETYQTGLSEAYLALHSDSRRFIDTYLATRIIWSGAGMVGDEGYEISQKARGIHFRGTEHLTHGNKMPHRHQGDGLIELRTGEGNMSEWAIRTKFDFTSLVLRLIEHGDIPLDILIEDGQETSTMQGISKDPTVNISTDTNVLSATEIQRAIAEHAMAFARCNPNVPKSELTAATAVLQACDDIEEYFYGDKSLERISDRIDWAAKLHKLHTRRIKLGDASCKNIIAVFHDLKWEDINPLGHSARWYRAHQLSHHSEGDLQRATKIAPRGLATRRTELLLQHRDDIVLANWNIIQRRNELPLKVTDDSKSTNRP